jgi:diaminopimelate epimerase
MKFTKMHGAGNDYVYVNCFEERVDNPEQVAIKVSNRNFGIGSDGLILIIPSQVADVRMRMFNSDGSESEMCGNGIRCVAKMVYDHGIAKKTPLTIETGNGVLTLELQLKDNHVDRVRVDMGEPRWRADQIPTTISPDAVIDFSGHALDLPVNVDRHITCVNTGNPHVVLFCDSVGEVPLEKIGPYLENHSVFPSRTNVHFVDVVSSREVNVRTWERGSGITQACGTGACAVAVATAKTGRTGRHVLAHLPGGDLHLDWSESDNHVYMTGPAVEVFSGEWPD